MHRITPAFILAALAATALVAAAPGGLDDAVIARDSVPPDEQAHDDGPEDGGQAQFAVVAGIGLNIDFIVHEFTEVTIALDQIQHAGGLYVSTPGDCKDIDLGSSLVYLHYASPEAVSCELAPGVYRIGVGSEGVASGTVYVYGAEIA